MKNLKELLFKTNNDWTGLIARLTVGLVLLPHGAQKMLGLFGGHGFSGTMNFFTSQMGLPWLLAFAVIIIEFFGATALILGFASRLWSIAIIFLFIGIIITTQFENGFFMNWFGNQKGEGFEFSLLLIGTSLAILVNGSGKYAIDNLINKK